jgi:carbon-monoxide dehydrogenase large subunit
VSRTLERPKSIGARVLRLEDPRLLSGRARYIDDIRRPRMLYLAIARSQEAHARIDEIDVESALALGDDIQVFTGADTIGLAVTANAEYPEVQFSQQSWRTTPPGPRTPRVWCLSTTRV